MPTPAGWELFAIVVGLLTWGERHLNNGESGWQVRHRDCGADVTVEVCCAEHPGVGLSHLDTTASPGPAARPFEG